MFDPTSSYHTDTYVSIMEQTGILSEVKHSVHVDYKRSNLYRELRTMQLNFGIRSGKTTAIHAIIDKLIAQDKLYLFINSANPSENTIVAVTPAHSYEKAIDSLSRQSRMRAIHSTKPSYVTVFVEEPRLCFPTRENLRDFYMMLDILPVSYVFMLGE